MCLVSENAPLLGGHAGPLLAKRYAMPDDGQAALDLGQLAQRRHEERVDEDGVQHVEGQLGGKQARKDGQRKEVGLVVVQQLGHREANQTGDGGGAHWNESDGGRFDHFDDSIVVEGSRKVTPRGGCCTLLAREWKRDREAPTGLN